MVEESLRLFRAAGDRRGMAGSLVWLGWHHHDRGDLAHGAQLTEEALALAREIGDKDGIQTGLWHSGVIAYRAGDVARARRLLEEQLALAQAWGRIGYIAGALLQLAVTERYAGNLTQAEHLFEQRRRLPDWPGLTSPSGIAIERRYVGDLAFDQGEIERATRLYAESLAGFGALGHQWDCAAGIEAVAAVADARGSAPRAVRLWGAATAIRARISAPLPPVERPRRDAALARLHTTLGATLYAAAWAEGEAMTLEQAIAYALGDDGQAADVSR
jgi:non-specific serine/threonine protein kinase